MKTTLIIFSFLIYCFTPLQAQKRIISIGSVATEYIFALGMGNQVVALDLTSNYPKETEKKPNLGHSSQIGIEGILSHNPDLVVTSENGLSADIINQLHQLKIKTFVYKQDFTLEGSIKLLNTFGEVLNKNEKAQDLGKDLKKRFELATNIQKSKKNTLFIYARGSRMLLVAGGNTSISHLITLAGAHNVANEIKDYKPLNTEALIKYNPESIIMFTHSVQGFKNEDEIWDIQGMNLTIAGKTKTLITIDASLASSFGLRLPEAITELNKALNE